MYDALAPAYDRFNRRDDYEKIAAFLFPLLYEQGIDGGVLCDLACGTGTLSKLALDMGFDVVAVDISPDMLAEARQKSDALTLVCQDMRELDLFGTFRACICTMDAINHITEPQELSEVFRRIALFCEPNGVFVFDVNTAHKLNRLCGSAFTDEDEDYFVAWSVDKTGECLYEFCVDVFSCDDDGLYTRETDIFEERAYSTEELRQMLDIAGFDLAGIYGDCVMSPPKDDEERIFFVARRRPWQILSE